MYKEKISAWVDAHKDEMLEDICELCRVNSEKMPAEEDMPFGPGTAECLDMALDMAEGYGFETCDYDGYVGCVDMNEEQITEVIRGVLAELGIEQPTAADKGRIMKVLMPRVKGKADGKLVNQTLAAMTK